MFWTLQVPTSCFPTLFIVIHIEHICSFFVAFFSATIDGRNLIFGHKLYIVTQHRGKRFWIHHIPTSCLPTLLIFLHIEHTMYMLIFRRIFLSNYWWQKSDIWSQASYRNAILWEAFLFPVCRLSLFLYTLNIIMHIFRHIFLNNYWWQKSGLIVYCKKCLQKGNQKWTTDKTIFQETCDYM